MVPDRVGPVGGDGRRPLRADPVLHVIEDEHRVAREQVARLFVVVAVPRGLHRARS